MGSPSSCCEAIVAVEAKNKSLSKSSTFEGGGFWFDIGIEQDLVEEDLEVIDGNRQCSVDAEQGRVDLVPVVELARSRGWRRSGVQ